MLPQLTTLRTITQYGLARLRVLYTTRSLWSTVIVSSVLVLAIIGTCAAWRARTGGEELPPAETTLAVSPLAELSSQTTSVPETPTATMAPSTAPTSLPEATMPRPITSSESVRDPFTDTTIGNAQAQRASREHECVTPHELAMLERERTITARRNVVARIAQDTDARVHPVISRAHSSNASPPPCPGGQRLVDSDSDPTQWPASDCPARCTPQWLDAGSAGAEWGHATTRAAAGTAVAYVWATCRRSPVSRRAQRCGAVTVSSFYSSLAVGSVDHRWWRRPCTNRQVGRNDSWRCVRRGPHW